MLSTVFEFLCSAFIFLCLFEAAVLLFVIVHEIFREKRKNLLDYYRNKRDKR